MSYLLGVDLVSGDIYTRLLRRDKLPLLDPRRYVQHFHLFRDPKCTAIAGLNESRNNWPAT